MLGIALVETVFALLVFVAVLAVMLETYTEVVVAAAMLVGIWKLFQFTGVNFVLAAGLIMLTAGLKLCVDGLRTLIEADTGGTRNATRFLDAVLTRQDEAENPDRRRTMVWTDDRDTAQLDTDVDSIEDYRR